MRTTTPHMQGQLAAETASLATCWHVRLRDGTALGFTDLDVDLVVAGLNYFAASGFTASAVDTSAALSVDGLDVEGMLSSPSITVEDLLSGRWDAAAIEIFLVDWSQPNAGRIIQRSGRLGQVSGEGEKFRAEIRGLMEALQQSMGAIYQPACRADFGDAQCKFNVSTVTTTCTVTGVSADGRTLAADELTLPEGAYEGGKITFLSGDNAGLPLEIKSNLPGTVTLQMPPPFEPAVGDAFDAVRGCLKRFNEDCRDTYSNVVNFRGEPHLPGMNKVIQPGGR